MLPDFIAGIKAKKIKGLTKSMTLVKTMSSEFNMTLYFIMG